MTDVELDREFLSGLAHPRLHWNSPLSLVHADRLLDALQLDRGTRIIDLGCGWGELLLRALARAPHLTGEGIDQKSAHIERAVAHAAAQGLSARVSFVAGDFRWYTKTADRAVCIGADHAWRGAAAGFSALKSNLHPNGLLLFGTGYWEAQPSAQLIGLFGALPSSLESLLSQVSPSEWTVLSIDVADREEWDSFEAGWVQDLRDIADREPFTRLGQRALRLARMRRDEYEHGYRGVLGFAYLTLKRSEEPRTAPV